MNLPESKELRILETGNQPEYAPLVVELQMILKPDQVVAGLHEIFLSELDDGVRYAACSRVCPEVAIMFPKYKAGPINGDAVSSEDVRREAMKVDISALLGGDIYQALRARTDAGAALLVKSSDPLELAGLCDAAEEDDFRRALEWAGLGSTLTRAAMESLGFHVCEADLEDELIRSLGAAAVEAIVEAQGELGSFRTLQKQPEWRGRPTDHQLRRFMGSGGSRKIRYARLLVEEYFDSDQVLVRFMDEVGVEVPTKHPPRGMPPGQVFSGTRPVRDRPADVAQRPHLQ